MEIINTLSLCLFLGITVSCNSSVNEDSSILSAHSHNDYKQEHPLYDALACHFRSIEADVYSIGDSLFVAHDFDEVRPGHTLRQLYLEPLKKQIKKNHGSVYGNGEEIILLIDIKDDGLRTYRLLDRILQGYKTDLSVFKNGVKTKGSIMVVVSGNRPFKYMQSQTVRYAGFDGRIKDLDLNISSTLMPMISDDWNNYFTWDGTGEMPLNEKLQLEKFATKAKSKGYILRFWGTPNRNTKQRNAVWQELYHAGVGLIGTDDLKRLQRFFLNTNK